VRRNNQNQPGGLKAMNAATLPMFHIKHLFVGIAMLLAAGLAVLMVPNQKLAEERPKIDLEQIVPKQFGNWKLDETIVPIQVNPEVQEKLNKIYSQTLARTYVNDKGVRVMLSIAYGSDQSDGMQLHRPEACYPAQGFEIVDKTRGVIEVEKRQVPYKRLLTRQGERVEPLTYWVVIGDEATRGDSDRKFARILLGLTGKIADGVLVRVSSINKNVADAYETQEAFIKSLASSLDERSQNIILGGVNGD
jgi:EpsI family protein